MKRWILLFGICLIRQSGYSQDLGIKSNILFDATTTINLGVEFALADKWTLDVSGNLNPWAFTQRKVTSSGELVSQHDAIIKHWMVQPELRWWLCEKFHGHYFGGHLHGGQFNVGGLSFLPEGWGDNGVRQRRFQGWFAGAGLSYGYHWILSSRFSLDFTIGGGYAYLMYDKYPSVESTRKVTNNYMMHYFGLTKAGISILYMIK